jgi:hypothetical protein
MNSSVTVCSVCRCPYTVDSTGDSRCAACRAHRSGCTSWKQCDKEHSRYDYEGPPGLWDEVVEACEEQEDTE